MEKDLMKNDVLEDKLDEISDDRLSKLLSDMIAKSEDNATVLNEKRLKELELLYLIMRSIVKGKEVKISYEVGELFSSSGSVTIIGREIEITNPKLFAETTKLASNMEIVPKVDGTVEINFTFHGILRSPKESKCFDMVSKVIDEYTKRFNPLLVENTEKKEELQSCCELIDNILWRFDGVSFIVEVDEETKDILMQIVCHGFEPDYGDRLLDILSHTKRSSVETSDEDHVRISFVFNGIWIPRDK